MSGELGTLGKLASFPSILRYLSFLAFLAGVDEGIGIIVVDSNILPELYLIFVIVLLAIIGSILTRTEKYGVFLSTLLIFFYGFLLMLSIPYYRISLLFLLPYVIEARNFSMKYGFRSSSGIWFMALTVSLAAMLLIFDLVRFFPATQNIVGMLAASISDDITPGGTPLLFLGGMVFFSRFFVFSISLQALLMFAALSFLLVENYFLIVRFFRVNSKSVIGGQVSGTLTVLSCQCESLAAAFPTIVALVLTAVMLPLILECLVLIFLTNYLLGTRFMRGRKSKFIGRLYPVRNKVKLVVPVAALIVALPILETIGVYFNWQSSLYFYGSINFLMLIAGIFVPILLSLSKVLKVSFSTQLWPALLVAISTVAMIIWFYSSLTQFTIANGSAFALMSIVSFAGGAIGGISYVGIGEEGKRLFLEYLAMMFTMFTIVIFYVSILAVFSIWPSFSLTEQAIFSIGVCITTLPFMWVATNIALNSSVRKGGVLSAA